MEDLVLKSQADSAELADVPLCVVGLRHACVLTPDGEFLELEIDEAANLLAMTPHLVVNRVMAARRLGLAGIRAYDALELYAFVRPARFVLPTIGGLLDVLGLNLPHDSDEDHLIALQACARHLLNDLASQTFATRAGATGVATMMAQAGWLWGPLIMKHVVAYDDHSREDGLKVWQNLEDWEDEGPPPAAGDAPILPEAAMRRLTHLLGDGAENRESQRRYAATATHAFTPREFQDGPNLQLLEAGTGTGKTLGYIAPASLWAEENGAPVWLATYTKNLQRQLDQELSKLYPEPRVKAKKAVIRKGRENYACLLNIEETLRAVMLRGSQAGQQKGAEDRDRILMGLVLRWARYSRDGDMIGGDFPAFLGAHFGVGRIAGLTDRRGECLFSACMHFRKCYVEKVARKAKNADLVVANHALVMAQMVNRADDPDRPRRFVFDEGHHVFDAADSAFSVRLSGQEGADLRRWLRGKEQGGTTRARGLKSRIEELVSDDTDARQLMNAVLEAATMLPVDNWLGRVTGAAAMTRFEKFLTLVRAQVFTRAADQNQSPYGPEATVDSPIDGLIPAAADIAEGLDGLMRPMAALATRLMHILDEDADVLDSTTRGRLESAARSLRLRADLVRTWTAMALSLGQDRTNEAGQTSASGDFVDWFEIDRIDGRERDIAMARHFVDPTLPFANEVLTDAHGVLVTSATLRDKGAEAEDWISADMRTGAQHLLAAPKRLSVPSPFDYPAKTRVFIVGDVNKHDPAQVASAYRALMMASGGGALGLFTAISRLKATYHHIAADMEAEGISVFAQHVDPIDTATLVDMFRADMDACLLGTDAVRDGVDVPGRSLRLIVFDRVPWPRPTLLHRARRAAFGGRHYDEMLTRLKLSQAFGRLVRSAGDTGAFVMLDGQTPTRLLDALPAGVQVERIGLAETVAAVKEFTKKQMTNP